MYLECNQGTYGKDCQHRCGSCINQTHCYYVNGTCLEGCDTGYLGDKCVDGNTESHFFLKLYLPSLYYGMERPDEKKMNLICSVE